MGVQLVPDGRTGSGRPTSPLVTRWPVAERELTDDEIKAQYGDLIEEALHHFEHDPTYVVDMAHSGQVAEVKRKYWAARRAG